LRTSGLFASSSPAKMCLPGATPVPAHELSGTALDGIRSLAKQILHLKSSYSLISALKANSLDFNLKGFTSIQ
jgi:hypothetical protein